MSSELFFHVIPNKLAFYIIPSIISDEYSYKWYLNNILYSTNKTICFIPDSFETTVKLELYDSTGTLVDSKTLTIDDSFWPKNRNKITTKSNEDFKLVPVKDDVTEKIIVVTPNTKIIDNNIFVTQTNADMKKHNLSDSDVTIEKLTDNVYKLYNFDDNFGIMSGTAELWFNETDIKQLIVVNNLIRNSYDKSGLHTVSNEAYFYDPMNSITLLMKGNSYESNNVFNIYTKRVENKSSGATEINDTYYINNVKFSIGLGDDTKYTVIEPSEWNHFGYVLHNGYIEVCAPYETTFEHRGVKFEKIRTIIVQGNKTCLTIWAYDKNGNKKPILIPPSQELKSVDYIKVSDKISFGNIECLQVDDLIYRFKQDVSVYWKPYIPGVTKIKLLASRKADNTTAYDKNLLLTTNENFIAISNDKFYRNSNQVVKYRDEVYTLDETCVINNNEVKLVNINKPLQLSNKHTHDVKSNFRFEHWKLRVGNITTDFISPNEITIQKLIQDEMKQRLGRVFDYKELFRVPVRVEHEVPFPGYILEFIDCSYRVIVPQMKNDNTVAWFDKRLMVLK